METSVRITFKLHGYQKKDLIGTCTKQLATNGDICDYWQRQEQQSKTMCVQIWHGMACVAYFSPSFSLVCETELEKEGHARLRGNG